MAADRRPVGTWPSCRFGADCFPAGARQPPGRFPVGAWARESDEGLRNLLEYVATGDVVGDEFVAELDAMVDDVNGEPERRAEMGGFMTLEYSMAVRADAAREEGLAEGEVLGAERAEARYAALIDRLLDDGRLDDLKRSTADPSLLHSLYADYGL